MNKLPDSCKDCAEFGSEFCEDCLEEITKDLPDSEKVTMSKVLRNLASMTSEKMGSTDSNDS